MAVSGPGLLLTVAVVLEGRSVIPVAYVGLPAQHIKTQARAVLLCNLHKRQDQHHTPFVECEVVMDLHITAVLDCWLFYPCIGFHLII